MTVESEALFDFALSRLRQDVARVLEDDEAVGAGNPLPAQRAGPVDEMLMAAVQKLAADVRTLEGDLKESLNALRFLKAENKRLREKAEDTVRMQSELKAANLLLRAEIARSRELEEENELLTEKNAAIVDFMAVAVKVPDEEQKCRDVLCAYVQSLTTENQRLREIIREIRRAESAARTERSVEPLLDNEPSQILITPPRSPDSHSSRIRSFQTPSSINISMDLCDLAEEGEMADVGRMVSPNSGSGGSPVVVLPSAALLEPEDRLPSVEEGKEAEAEIDASLESSNFDS